MSKPKKILITIPAEFNSKLNLHLLNIRDMGIEITKAELLIKFAQIGYNQEVKQ